MIRCCDSLKSLPLVQPDAISYEHSGYTVRLIHKELKPSVEVTKEPGVLPRTMWMSHLGSDLQAPVKRSDVYRYTHTHPQKTKGNVHLWGVVIMDFFFSEMFLCSKFSKIGTVLKFKTENDNDGVL